MQHFNFETSKAFMNLFSLDYSRVGPLNNLTFAVKDNIDVAGYKTSYGSQSWFDAHLPAMNHALCVEQLLNAGARCLGKTISDELTYSLAGENYFYGTPINPKAPERIPGGSSSGSASAVACGLVDFAIGTDCGGSTRVPASFCGILGMRPTTFRISESGILPFSPSVSTVGIFANEINVLEKVMHVLLRSTQEPTSPVKHIYLLEDAFAIADEEINEVLQDKIAYLKKVPNITVSSIKFSEIIDEEMSLYSCNEKALRVLQSVEIWNAIGSWILCSNPEMDPQIRRVLEGVKELDRSQLNEALYLCERIFTKIYQFTKPGDLFCFPTAPCLPPYRGELEDVEKGKYFYHRAMAITSFAGAGRLPEISIPVANIGNIPVGLSLAASHGQDEFLLAAVKNIFKENI